MEFALRISSLPGPKISHSYLQGNGKLLPRSVFGSGSGAAIRVQGVTCDNGGLQKRRSSVESPLFRYDTPIPEEIIEKPVGLLLPEKNVEKDFRCPSCQAKGAVLCATCSGSGLYIDSIMESQGIIVKVRCLGCGGTGNIMCSECGGRGHI